MMIDFAANFRINDFLLIYEVRIFVFIFIQADKMFASCSGNEYFVDTCRNAKMTHSLEYKLYNLPFPRSVKNISLSSSNSSSGVVDAAPKESSSGQTSLNTEHKLSIF